MFRLLMCSAVFMAALQQTDSTPVIRFPDGSVLQKTKSVGLAKLSDTKNTFNVTLTGKCDDDLDPVSVTTLVIEEYVTVSSQCVKGHWSKLTAIHGVLSTTSLKPPTAAKKLK